MRGHLADHGWAVDVVSAPAGPGAVELAESAGDLRRTATRARVTGAIGRAVDRPYAAAGLRPEAFPLSMAWIPRGAVAIRRRLTSRAYDAVVVTAPPHAALLAARAALGPRPATPLVVELRDLWAGSPAFDRGGPLLPALELWVLRAASTVVVMTPEAADDVQARHPQLTVPVEVVPNGFEPELLARRDGTRTRGPAPWTLLHSGIISADRPLAPLLRVLERPEQRDRWRLVLHGHLAPEARRELATHPGAAVEVVGPSAWEDAVDRIATADATLITQGHGAGDATAVASKVFEYLALGKPVLATTDGGATEALLRRLGADDFVARLNDKASIAAALDRLAAVTVPPLVPAETLVPYSRAATADRMAALLESTSAMRSAA